MDAGTLAALDIGGTHVTRALVDPGEWSVRPDSVSRRDLRSDGTAEQILGAIVGCARELDLSADAWCGIAIPGPFDTVRGVGLYRSGKFDALYGVDVRAAVADGIGLDPAQLVFVPDSQAFLRGEWVSGAARGHDRATGITLGTGVGSAFLADGEIVADGPLVPPEGRIDLTELAGRPLEDTMSRRALLAAYGEEGVDVRDIFDRARDGDDRAAEVIRTALTALSVTLAPWLDGFGATVLVVGGSMSGSWDLVEPELRRGLDTAAPALADRLALAVAKEREQSLLIGAAWECAQVRDSTGA